MPGYQTYINLGKLFLKLKQEPQLWVAVCMSVAVVWHFYVQIIWGYEKESWNITEFLINYQGGFIRRGLLGEIIHKLSVGGLVNAHTCIILICSISYICLVGLFVVLFIKRGYSLFLMPFVFFLGSPVINNFWVRKDIIILIIYISIVYLLRQLSVFRVLTINLVFCLGLLIHESIAFLAFPIIISAFFDWFNQKYKGSAPKVWFFSVASFILPLCLLGILYLRPADLDTAQRIWKSWESSYFPKDSHVVNPPAAIDGLTWSLDTGIAKTAIASLHNFSGGVYAPLAWFLIAMGVFVLGKHAGSLLLLKSRNQQHVLGDQLLSILLFNFFCLLPLYVISIDYGRWVFIWVTSSFGLFCVFGKDVVQLFPRLLIPVSAWLGRQISVGFKDWRYAWFVVFVMGLPKFEWDFNQYIDSTPMIFILKFFTKIITLYFMPLFN